MNVVQISVVIVYVSVGICILLAGASVMKKPRECDSKYKPYLMGMYGIFLSVVAYLLGFNMLVPMQEGIAYRHEIERQSAEAKFAMITYRQCQNPGPFKSNPEAYCRQMVEELAKKQHGDAYSIKAVSAVDELSNKLARRFDTPSGLAKGGFL